MRIIKEGELPQEHKVTLRGKCDNCGCVIEEEYGQRVVRSIPYVDCPTEGCNKSIFMLKKYHTDYL